MWTNKIKGIPKYILKKIENNGSEMYNKLELDYYRKHKKVPKHPIPSREEKEFIKGINFITMIREDTNISGKNTRQYYVRNDRKINGR